MGQSKRIPLVAIFFVLGCVLASDSSTASAKGKGKGAADALVAKADQIAIRVAKLRGLELKNKIERGVMSKAQIKARIVKLLAKEYSAEDLDAESLAMKRFGLIAPDADYVKMMLDMLEEQIAGFYDQHEKKLFIAGWAPMGGEMLMAHEIDHALQDQNFDLVKFMKVDKDNGDSQAARQALVEGDGMALMLEFQLAQAKQGPPWGNDAIVAMIKQGMAQGLSSVKGVPLALSEGLIFPYSGGLDFVAHFRKHHPWSRIDEIYKKPPLSTEHILHPEAYEAYEKPVPVTAARPAVLSAYEDKKSLVQGEKGLELFLKSHGVDTVRAVTAAAGWGGDRASVYALKSHTGSDIKGTIGVSLTTWDQAADASEFFEALEQALPKLSGGALVERADKVLEFSMPSGGSAQAELRGQDVLLLIDVPPGSGEVLRADLWKSWRVAR